MRRFGVLAALASGTLLLISVLTVAEVIRGGNALLWLEASLVLAGIGLTVRYRNHVFLTAASVAAALLLVDAALLAYERFVLDVEGWQYSYTTTNPYKTRDALLHTRLLPSTVARETKRFHNGDVVFQDVQYRIDEKGRRATGYPASNQAEQHALFFGCSYTFGMGIPTERTLPAVFAGLSGGTFNAYNYAVGGYGAGQTYLLLDDDQRFNDVRPARGIAIYSFFHDHLNRSAAYKFSRLISLNGSPLFRLGEGGELQGPFHAFDEQPLGLWLNLYDRVRIQSPTTRQLFRIRDVSYVTEREAVDVLVQLLSKAAGKYTSRFPAGKFHVLIWPRSPEALEDPGYLISRLRAADLAVLQLEPFPEAAHVMIHPHDPHPSAEETEWIARHIYPVFGE